MELSRLIKEQALQIHGKLQMIFLAYARALESIPRHVAKNAGFDSVNVLNLLRQKHTQGKERCTFVFASVLSLSLSL